MRWLVCSPVMATTTPVLIPEAHARGCDDFTLVAHLCLDHGWDEKYPGYRPRGRSAERWHTRLHLGDPEWWALPDYPWAFVTRPLLFRYFRDPWA